MSRNCLTFKIAYLSFKCLKVSRCLELLQTIVWQSLQQKQSLLCTYTGKDNVDPIWNEAPGNNNQLVFQHALQLMPCGGIIHADGQLSHCDTFQLNHFINVVIQSYMHVGSDFFGESRKHYDCCNTARSLFIFSSQDKFSSKSSGLISFSNLAIAYFFDSLL